MTWFLTWKNLRVKWVTTLITVLVIALATAIALVVPMVTRQVERGAQDAAQVFDVLVTKRGSPTQAVLSSLFYLDVPIGNIPFQEFERLQRDERGRRVVPLGFGDNFAGFPVVGTSKDFFTLQRSPKEGPYFQLGTGREFAQPFEAVLGHKLAEESGLKVGDHFGTDHGREKSIELEDAVAGEGMHQHEEEYTVVGVLRPTGGPVDRAVLTPIETLWDLHHSEEREVTAVLFTGRTLADVYNVASELNRSGELMATLPGQVFAQFGDLLMQGQRAYGALAGLVMLLAALTVGLSVYANGLQRLKGVAILRALGASGGLVFRVVLLETLGTVTVGVLLGLGVAWGLCMMGAGWLSLGLGFSLPGPEWSWPLVGKALLLIPFSLLLGIFPAWQARRVSPLRHV